MTKKGYATVRRECMERVVDNVEGMLDGLVVVETPTQRTRIRIKLNAECRGYLTRYHTHSTFLRCTRI